MASLFCVREISSAVVTGLRTNSVSSGRCFVKKSRNNVDLPITGSNAHRFKYVSIFSEFGLVDRRRESRCRNARILAFLPVP